MIQLKRNNENIKYQIYSPHNYNIYLVHHNSFPNNNYCLYIKTISPFPGEEEVLITAYSTFIVKKIENNNDGKIYIHMICVGYLLNENNVFEWPATATPPGSAPRITVTRRSNTPSLRSRDPEHPSSRSQPRSRGRNTRKKRP